MIDKQMQELVLKKSPWMRPETFALCDRHVFYYCKSVAPPFAPTMFKKIINPSFQRHQVLLKEGWSHYLTIHYNKDLPQETTE